MAVVDHHESTMLVGEITDGVEPRHVTIHGENAVGGDHSNPFARRLFE